MSPGSRVAFGNSQGESVARAEQNLPGVTSVSEAHGREADCPGNVRECLGEVCGDVSTHGTLPDHRRGEVTRVVGVPANIDRLSEDDEMIVLDIQEWKLFPSPETMTS